MFRLHVTVNPGNVIGIVLVVVQNQIRQMTTEPFDEDHCMGLLYGKQFVS
jgi:hypothetical protein